MPCLIPTRIFADPFRPSVSAGLDQVKIYADRYYVLSTGYKWQALEKDLPPKRMV